MLPSPDRVRTVSGRVDRLDGPAVPAVVGDDVKLARDEVVSILILDDVNDGAIQGPTDMSEGVEGWCVASVRSVGHGWCAREQLARPAPLGLRSLDAMGLGRAGRAPHHFCARLSRHRKRAPRPVHERLVTSVLPMLPGSGQAGPSNPNAFRYPLRPRVRDAGGPGRGPPRGEPGVVRSGGLYQPL